MVLVFATWFEAVGGWLATRDALAPWAPDLGLLFFLAIAARLGQKLMARKRETVGTFGLVVAISWAESATSSLTPAPILAGWLGVLMWQGFWRRGVDVERPLLRILISGSAALGLLGWRHLVLGLDLADETQALGAVLALPDAGAWRGALLTAALAPLFMPFALALPGVGLYWRER
ncbi:MAG: hypothetical protein H8D72_01575 [Planctomycetes bacterium]|nr:hypothetical protein [Planctomycetota bacterium]